MHGIRANEDVSRREQHGAERNEERHERITVPIDQSEDADPDVQHADHHGGEPRVAVAATQPLPHPDQRDTERKHAATNEIPDDVDHRMHVGLDGKRVERLMERPRLQAVAEGAKPNDEAVDQKERRSDGSHKPR